MPMDSRVKFLHPQNIYGASQQNRVAQFSLTTEVNGDSSGVIQVCGNPIDAKLISKDIIYTLTLST